MSFLDRKCVYYERNYLRFKFRFHNILLIFFTIIGATVVSLGDAQAFFIGENSPIPKNWTFFKKTSNAKLLALIAIIIPSVSFLITKNKDEKEELNNVSKITQRITLPFFENNLNHFHANICQKFQLSLGSRIYIMIPIRKKSFHWHLKTFVKTKNFNDKEIDILLKLDEGAIGYAFQSMNKEDKFSLLHIPLTNSQNLPANYKNFSRNNKVLVRADNKSYLAAPIFDQDFLSGIFIIDTNDTQDLISFEKKELHQEILNWIENKQVFITLLWRLNNNDI